MRKYTLLGADAGSFGAERVHISEYNQRQESICEKAFFTLLDSVFCCSVLAFGQTPSVGEVSFRALTVTKDGAITHLKGNVEVAIGHSSTLRSEQADYNSDTGEIAARGNVRITRQGSPIAKQADEAEVNVRTGDVKARVGAPLQAPR